MLELKNINYTVPAAESHNGKPVEIIKDITVTIPDGSFTVITGPNGGGKSTISKIIMGIIKPTSGQILFNGDDITELSIDERARMGVCYGFQAPARFNGMKVRKLLQLASGKEIDTNSCNKYLSSVGLCSGDYLDRGVDKGLSGGELKRIEIASVLAREPKLAIFDEPEAGIDLWSFGRLTETLGDMHRNSPENTIIVISHQERIIEKATDIMVLEKGAITSYGTKEKVLPSLLFNKPVDPSCVITPEYNYQRVEM